MVVNLIKGNMVDNREFSDMFLGYPENHAEGTYLMMNVKTKRAVITRSANWLDKSFGKNQKLKSNEICRLPFDKSEEEIDEEYKILDVEGIDQELKRNNEINHVEQENSLGIQNKILSEPIEEEIVFESDDVEKKMKNIIKGLKMESFNRNPENIINHGRVL